MLLYAFIILFFIVLVLLIFILWRENNEEKSGIAVKGHGELKGDGRDARLIEQVNAAKDPTLEDYFVAGEAARNLGHNPEEFYVRAIQHIPADREVEPAIAGFIVGRIGDYFDRVHGEDLELQAALLDTYHLHVQQAPEPKTKTEAQQMFFKKTVVNDPQNVHDSQVIDNTRRKLSRISDLSVRGRDRGDTLRDPTRDTPRDPTRDHPIQETIRAAKLSGLTPGEADSVKARAFKVISRAINNPVKVEGMTNTGDVVLKVWDRIHARENDGKRADMIEMFIKQMADATGKDGHIVCANGICGRALDSLTLLDSDPKLAQPTVTTDMVKVELLNKSHKILTSELEKLDPRIRGDYENGETTAETSAFSDSVKEKINEEINTYKLSPVDKQIMIDSVAGVV